ncbi:MAG TPA: EAL domain-containing protein [Nitrospira sp.]|nr:EAL domain-containing protein [Nitrospira sp.]
MKLSSKSSERSASLIGKRAVQTAVIVGFLMWVFEATKMVAFPHLQVGVSQLLTVLFVTVMAAICSVAVLKQSNLPFEMDSGEERYRLLLEGSLAGAYRTTVDGRVLDCNIAFCQIFGYASREEVIGNSVIVGYLSSIDREQFTDKLRAEGHLINFEQRLQRKDGSIVTILNSAILAEGEDGSAAVINGTFTDISELRQAEQENRRLAAIVRCSEDAIISLTIEGEIETWNRGAERIYEYSAEEVIGRSIDILAPAGRSNEFRQILGRVGNGDQVLEFETIRARKDGRQIAISLSVSPIADSTGVIVGASSIARDITDRKRSEDALRKTEAQYRLLFEGNPLPMWVFSLTTLRFLAVNQSAIEQYGFSELEFLAMTIADIFPHEEVPNLLQVVAKRNHGMQGSGVGRLHKKGGAIIDVEIVSHHLDFQGIDAILVGAHDVTKRKQAEEALTLKTALLEAQSETTIDGILVVNESGRILLANKQLGLHFSVPDALLRSGDDQNVLNYFTDLVEDSESFMERVKYLYDHQDEKSRDEFRLKNGKTFDRYSAPLIDSEGRRRGRIWYFRDITERKQAEVAVRRAEEKYRAIFEDSVLGIFQITPEGRPVSINRAMAKLHGYESPEELMAEVHNLAEQLFVDPSQMIKLAKTVAKDTVALGVELEVYRNDHSKRWVRVNLRAVHDAYGEIGHYEGTVEDITEGKAAEARIQFLAYYDALTELPHRALLQDRLGNALADARRRDEFVALLFLDLDRFKVVNDSYGRSFGDDVLNCVAQRLRGCTREQDTLARIGSDEFLVVLAGVDDVAEAAIAADRVMNALREEFTVQGRSLGLSCSVGISIFPEHGTDGETLIKNAEVAMYSAKDAGRKNVCFFTDDLNAQAAERLSLENELHLALEREEFFLVYQPQMEIATGTITGFEALIRWRNSELGLVPPDRFIPIAESNGLILEVGEWVLRTACEQARKWMDDGLLAMPVAVNVSAIQLRQKDFSALVRGVLKETRLPAQYLELELTESVLLSNQHAMSAVLQDLKEMGVKLAIDDFGTGYSNLSYLKHFRVNKLKIDRSFIRDITNDSDDAAITAAIISMAKSLNLKVIAEGVENEEQMSFLRELRCDEIQGYYFSKPVTGVEVSERILYAPFECKR